ncbi:MAG TPA: L,D-transpeptidase family protein [Acidobacteriaceae bacterium]|jgi:D-alanyl-D-alanine dipeptidase|nr:L,D-transpeptidase family protein [Acidobacteriaceae bacterium]
MKSKFLVCCLLAVLPCLVFAQEAPSSALAHSTQLIVVTTSGWSAVSGRLQRYQRSAPGDRWRAAGDPITIVVGKKGLGWGIGVVSIPAARNADDPVKREGDRKSPAGIFRLGTTFGYAPHKPGDWKMPYLPLTPSIDCVDDSHSRYYNQVMDRSTVSVDWKSAEHMRDAGEAYRWGLVIDHNTTDPRPEGGSCVFMHIWAGPGMGTVGCTAMPEQQVKQVLGWLNPAANPLLVQMPLRSYRLIEKSFRLPPPPAPSSL